MESLRDETTQFVRPLIISISKNIIMPSPPLSLDDHTSIEWLVPPSELPHEDTPYFTHFLTRENLQESMGLTPDQVTILLFKPVNGTELAQNFFTKYSLHQFPDLNSTPLTAEDMFLILDEIHETRWYLGRNGSVNLFTILYFLVSLLVYASLGVLFFLYIPLRAYISHHLEIDLMGLIESVNDLVDGKGARLFIGRQMHNPTLDSELPHFNDKHTFDEKTFQTEDLNDHSHDLVAPYGHCLLLVMENVGDVKKTKTKPKRKKPKKKSESTEETIPQPTTQRPRRRSNKKSTTRAVSFRSDVKKESKEEEDNLLESKGDEIGVEMSVVISPKQRRRVPGGKERGDEEESEEGQSLEDLMQSLNVFIFEYLDGSG